MPTLAFWNTNGSVSPVQVKALAREQDVDVLILAENRVPLPELLRSLNRGATRLYFPDAILPEQITVFTRFPPQKSHLVRDSFGASVRHYRMPLGESFTVVAVHCPSKLWKKTEDQILGSTRLARLVRESESQVGHQRTIVIGDMNMNPFEAGVVGSEGFHAIADRRIAARGSRIVHGESRTFFYNPMWSAFGDRGSSPPGTYFYDAGGEVNYYWNVFDQVLVRPALLDALPQDGVRVVWELGGLSLLDRNGRPAQRPGSDHLPIVCRFSEIWEPTNASDESVG